MERVHCAPRSTRKAQTNEQEEEFGGNLPKKKKKMSPNRQFTLSPALFALSFPIEQRDDLSQHSHAYLLTKATSCDGNCKTLTKCRVAKVHKCAGTGCNLDWTTACACCQWQVLDGPNKINYDSAVRQPSTDLQLINTSMVTNPATSRQINVFDRNHIYCKTKSYSSNNQHHGSHFVNCKSVLR